MPPDPSQSVPDAPDHRSLIIALLRGAPAPWPEQWGRADETAFVRAILDHGVAALVRGHAMASGAWAAWPEDVTATLADHVRQQAAVEVLRRRELQSVLAAFADNHIDCLLLKGTPLAYTLYASPEERPRGDTDILIRAAQRAAVENALKPLGYRSAPMVSGQRVMHQLAMHKSDRFGIRYTLDLHWKLTNPQVFADVWTFEELHARRNAVRALGPRAYTLSTIDALLYACVHRIAHHADEERLIWLYDIHRLLARRSADEWRQIIERATGKHLGAVCLAGFEAAEDAFGAGLPRGIAEELAARIDREAERPMRAYLKPGRRRVQYLWSDLKQLDWNGRATLLRETAFPSAEYMLRHYGVANRALLVLLYPYRILTGAWHMLRRPKRRVPRAGQVE